MLGSGMLVGGVFVALTLSSKVLAGSGNHLGARIAQVITFAAMALFFLPYLLPLFQG